MVMTKTIVIKFWKELNPAIQNKVVLTRDNTLDFDNPEGWYEAAQKVAQTWEANEAFVESSRGATQLNRPPIPTPKAVPPMTYAFGAPWKISFQPTPTCALGAAPSSSKDGPEPIDVDCTHSQSNFPIICQCCNKPGHYARECPNAFDIWNMTTQEKLELIPKLPALADTLEMPPLENNSDLEAEAEMQKEDSVNCSR